MDSKLIQEAGLEQQLNMLLEEIDYQLEHSIECKNQFCSRCSQCIYNVGRFK